MGIPDWILLLRGFQQIENRKYRYCTCRADRNLLPQRKIETERAGNFGGDAAGRKRPSSNYQSRLQNGWIWECKSQH